MSINFSDDPSSIKGSESDKSSESIGPCPCCAMDVVERDKAYQCITNTGNSKESPCNFGIGKKVLGKEITRDDVIDLINNRETKLMQGFISNRTGNMFSAKIILREGSNDLAFDFMDNIHQVRERKNEGRG